MVLTESDNGGTASARVDETIRVRLPENASSGFRWAIASLKGGVQPQSSSVDAVHVALGAGGTVTWTFKAVAPGSARIALKLWRQWEGESSVAARFEFTLDVRQ